VRRRWTLDQAIEHGHLMAFIAQEEERGITPENAQAVEEAVARLERRARQRSRVRVTSR
jgi:hypothetical protein